MRSKAFLLAGIAGAMVAFPAQAQDAGDDDKDIIIVTATLRAADVQDIPLAVTAVQPVELERQGIADIKSLSSLSPSFNSLPCGRSIVSNAPTSIGKPNAAEPFSFGSVRAGLAAAAM